MSKDKNTTFKLLFQNEICFFAFLLFDSCCLPQLLRCSQKSFGLHE